MSGFGKLVKRSNLAPQREETNNSSSSRSDDADNPPAHTLQQPGDAQYQVEHPRSARRSNHDDDFSSHLRSYPSFIPYDPPSDVGVHERGRNAAADYVCPYHPLNASGLRTCLCVPQDNPDVEHFQQLHIGPTTPSLDFPSPPPAYVTHSSYTHDPSYTPISTTNFRAINPAAKPFIYDSIANPHTHVPSYAPATLPNLATYPATYPAFDWERDPSLNHGQRNHPCLRAARQYYSSSQPAVSHSPSGIVFFDPIEDDNTKPDLN